jgi:aryl-alcohol dehydrogenase-like predicted oxidoreductase
MDRKSGDPGFWRRKRASRTSAGRGSGINFFDTADMYSFGVSEEITGRALKEFGGGRDRVVIATKVFQPMGDDPNQRGLSRKHILHAIDASLKRLDTGLTSTCTRSIAWIIRRRWRKS